MEKTTERAWKQEWENHDSIESSASWIGKQLRHRRLRIVARILTNIKHQNGPDVSVIDLGCGGGTTLKVIRGVGLRNSIGIDFIQDAINHCRRQGFKSGKDVFLVDAKDTPYKDRCFTVGFSEGLWEHFTDPEPYIVEACRITDKYLLVIQPDHYSLFGSLLHWAWERFGGGGVKEYSFPISYFIKLVEDNGFSFVKREGTVLREQAILLFRRRK